MLNASSLHANSAIHSVDKSNPPRRARQRGEESYPLGSAFDREPGRNNATSVKAEAILACVKGTVTILSVFEKPDLPLAE